MNKKAFTVVELIVTFALTMTIAVFLFQIIMALKDLYISYGTKTELLNKQSLISYQINNAFSNKKIKNITKCGSYCLNFIYADDSTDKLFLDKDNLVFQFGDYKVILPDGSSFGDIDVNVYISPVFDSNHNDSILSINIAIYNSLLKNQNFGVSAVYQYNSLNSNITKVVFDSNESEYGAILLKGNIQTSAYNDETYTDADYTLLDKDGNVITNPSLVTIDNPFSSMSAPYKAGKYDIKYYYKDASGNVIDIKTRTVTINDHIKLELVGDNEISVAQNSSYADSGYNVVDGSGNVVDISNYDGYLVNTTNNVNTSVTGTYAVTYTLTYNGEDVSICTRTVNVLYKDASGANAPRLASGMIPIKWNETTEVTTTTSDSDWYDYSNKKWANAKTADGSYWVWIPRYAYKISSGWHTSTTGIIDVIFLKNDTIENSSNTTIQTSGYSTTGTNTSNAYFLEPAFQNSTGNTKYGFWVAKFEASVSNTSDACYTSASIANCNKTTLTPKSVPNVNSWRYSNIGNFYTVASNMSTNTSYGWTSGSVDTHMMTNYEWGAVAYLTQSSYGKNNEVWINNSSTYITGCAGSSVSASSYSGCQNAYNTTTGMNASTTGNITGIYDMSGGAWEYTAAYVNNGSNRLIAYGNSIINATKNKNIYSITTDSQVNNYDANKNIYGDAVYETSSGDVGNGWNSDYSYMPYSDIPWFLRGGLYGNSSNAGLFNFNNTSGDANGSAGPASSFRLIVMSTQ